MIMDKHKNFLNKIKQDFLQDLGFLMEFQSRVQAKIASMYLSKDFEKDLNNYLERCLNQIRRKNIS